MRAQRLPNGNLLVPHRAEAPDGTIGDAMFEIGPDDPGWSNWMKDLEQQPGDAQPVSAAKSEDATNKEPGTKKGKN